MPLDVLGAHVDDAREVEQRAGRRGRHAVLAGAGLGDHPGLAEPPREQRLAEGVVDLVRPGVGEVLALEVEPEVRDAGSAGAATGETRRLVAHGLGQAIGTVQRRRAAGEMRQQVAQLGPEDRVVPERVVGDLELLERGHQRLRDVAATEIALHPPPAGAVGVEETGVDGRRAERDVGAIVAGRPSSLHEQRDPERILGRTLADDARALDPRRHVDADRGDGTEGAGDVGRVETAGQGDRHLPGDRGGQALGGTRPGPAGMRPTGGIEEEPLDAGIEECTSARDEVGGDGRWVAGFLGREMEDLPGPAPHGPGRLDRFGAAELDDVGVDLGDDAFEASRGTHRR